MPNPKESSAQPEKRTGTEKLLDSGREGEKSVFLVSAGEAGEFRARWKTIQTRFVDEPRGAVQEADAPVADVIRRITESFADERSGLERQWSQGGDVSTEDLRVAMQRYRSLDGGALP